MPHARDFAPAAAQAILFTPEEGLSVPRLMRELAPRWQRFDGAPTVLPPVPEGLPGDFPRVTLVSADGRWRFDAASARATVTCQATPDIAEIPTTRAEFLAEAAAMLLEYRAAFRMRVGRLAAISTSAAPSATPGVELARHFCQDRWQAQPFNRPEAFELHAHKRYDIRGWGAVNSWMRVKTGHLTRPGGAQTPIIVTEQDLNTPPEQAPTKDYTDEQIAAFFAMADGEFATILGLYFPEATQ